MEKFAYHSIVFVVVVVVVFSSPSRGKVSLKLIPDKLKERSFEKGLQHDIEGVLLCM